jgi:hypothetical protein
MQKIMKRIFYGFLLVFLLLKPAFVFAAAVFNIVPNLLNITLPTVGTGKVIYTVTNDTSHSINKISIKASYQSDVNTSALFIRNDTCTSSTLAVKQSCSFQLAIANEGQPDTFQLRLRVCGSTLV